MHDPENEISDPLKGKRVSFVGRLASMARRDAARLVRQHGAVVVDQTDASIHLVVVGEADLPLPAPTELEELFDLDYYLKHVGTIFSQVFGEGD